MTQLNPNVLHSQDLNDYLLMHTALRNAEEVVENSACCALNVCVREKHMLFTCVLAHRDILKARPDIVVCC